MSDRQNNTTPDLWYSHCPRCGKHLPASCFRQVGDSRLDRSAICIECEMIAHRKPEAQASELREIRVSGLQEAARRQPKTDPRLTAFLESFAQAAEMAMARGLVNSPSELFGPYLTKYGVEMGKAKWGRQGVTECSG